MICTKRKTENMLSEIRYNLKNTNQQSLQLSYKGKTFEISVKLVEVNNAYSYYEASINGNVVKRFHMLRHIFHTSRYDEHCGFMREYEETEIISELYGCIKKENEEQLKKKFAESSYFNKGR